MMRLKLFLVLHLTLSSCWGVQVCADTTPEYWQAELGTNAALRLHGSDALYQRAINVQALLEDSGEAGFYKAKFRGRWDTVYSDDNPYSEAAEDAYERDADWRHLYVGKSLGSGELTLGLQQVVWGRADEVRVLDQINPLDYREGVAALLETSRIAVPMLRFTHPVADWELEALWITDFEENRPPEVGSEFYSMMFAQPDDDEFFVSQITDYEAEDAFSYGFNLNGNISGIDTSWVALSARQQDPVYSPTGTVEGGRTALQKSFPRYNMAGMGLAFDPGYSLVVRSELAYFREWHFNNVIHPSGYREGDMIKGLIGVDYLWRNWLIATQWWRQQISEHHIGDLQPKTEDLLTVSAEGSTLSDRLTSRLVLAFSPPFNHNGLMQGLFTYRPSDSVRLGLQLDIYFGTDTTLFGAYDRQDNVRASVDFLFN